MIFSEGMYLGFAFFLSWISECNFARILFAMAVPSIFWAVMTGLDVEKDAFPGSSESLPKGRGQRVHEAGVVLLLFRTGWKMGVEGAVEVKKYGGAKGPAENKVVVFRIGAGGQNRGVRAAGGAGPAGRTEGWSGSAEARCLSSTQAESGPELLAKGP